MVDPDDDEVMCDEALDEMASYFNRETTPKVLITISPAAKVVGKKNNTNNKQPTLLLI